MLTFPAQYIDYFQQQRPKEGSLTVEPGWFQLSSPDKVEELNREYKIHEFAPGFLAFGSSGGGELLAFDALKRVVMLPVISMSPEAARVIADSWTDFVQTIAQ